MRSHSSFKASGGLSRYQQLDINIDEKHVHDAAHLLSSFNAIASEPCRKSQVSYHTSRPLRARFTLVSPSVPLEYFLDARAVQRWLIGIICLGTLLPKPQRSRRLPRLLPQPLRLCNNSQKASPHHLDHRHQHKASISLRTSHTRVLKTQGSEKLPNQTPWRNWRPYQPPDTNLLQDMQARRSKPSRRPKYLHKVPLLRRVGQTHRGLR